MRRHLYSFLALLALLAPAALAAQDDDSQDDRPRRERDRDRDDCRCGLREVSDRDRGHARRHGIWFSAGLGAGAESFDANDGLGWSDDETGGVAFAKLGGTVSRSFLLGVEGHAWGTQYQGLGYDRTLTSLMFIGQWYPAPASGFWLKGGLGFARDNLDFYGQNSANFATHENGTAFSLGIGYDVPVGRAVSITPLLDLQAQRYDTHDERIVSFGVGITVH